MKIIKVKTDSKNYEIKVGNDLLGSIPLKKLVSQKDILLIIDSQVPELLINKLKKNLKKSSSKKINSIKINASENNKNMSYLAKVYDFLIRNNYSRDCIIFGIGGGITCDMTGFIASTFLRGVDFVLVPSTLLSQVDASIGGKTGVNHKGFKNMIGTFNQPAQVIIDTKFLKSLSKLEIRCGMMEVIKHGLISDKKFFVWLEKNLKQILSLKPQFIESAIKRSIEIKAEVVSKDEKENGIRAILNFGHTFGHALETIGDNKLYSHGEAVALGMLAATKLSERNSNLDRKVFDRVHSMLKNTGINVNLKKKIIPKKLIKLMQSDKKKNNSQLKFILLEKIGKAKIKTISNEVVIENAIKNSLFY
tara:strand:+ start:1057 stop:2145 length:1089 start_codon:yes stop_codon:yes gene_type:complete